MKKLVVNLVKSTLVGALMLGSSSIYAVGDVKIAPISGSKKARVYIATDQSTNVHLTVLNENGTEYLYSEKLSSEANYNKVYDFNQLEEGVYKIVAESDSKTVEKDISITKEGITVIGEAETYKPYFKIDGGKLIVSYLNNKTDDVNVSFSDGKDVFYTGKSVKDFNFMKAYDLSNLVEGEYIVKLNSGDESYNYYFEVR